MIKSLATALVASTALLGTGVAHAGGHVSWSIGIGVPVVGAVVGSAPYYAGAPVYVEPAPLYVEPAPVYVEPAPVYAAPVPAYYGYYRPAPVVYPYHRWHREWRERRDWDRHDHDGHRH